jgi:hypothetical protein
MVNMLVELYLAVREKPGFQRFPLVAPKQLERRFEDSRADQVPKGNTRLLA